MGDRLRQRRVEIARDEADRAMERPALQGAAVAPLKQDQREAAARRGEHDLAKGRSFDLIGALHGEGAGEEGLSPLDIGGDDLEEGERVARAGGRLSH